MLVSAVEQEAPFLQPMRQVGTAVEAEMAQKRRDVMAEAGKQLERALAVKG